MLSAEALSLRYGIDWSEILYLHSEGTHNWLIYLDSHTQQCLPISGNLCQWEKKLPHFWRINESYLVNPALIYRFHPAEMPHFPLPLIELITGRCFAVSYKKTAAILQKWQQLQCSIIS